MKKAYNRKLFETIRRDLAIVENLTTRHQENLSRSDTRRMVEDVFELKRYQNLHDDVLEEMTA